MKQGKVILSILTLITSLFLYGATSDPLQEYLKLENEYFNLLEKLKSYSEEEKKLNQEIKRITLKYTRLKAEKKKFIDEIKLLGNFDPSTSSDISLLLSTFSPEIREVFTYESEIAAEIGSRIRNLNNLTGEMEKIRAQKKKHLKQVEKVTALIKETLEKIKNEREEKLSLIKKIFSNKKTLKEYLKMRRKSIGELQITYENTPGKPFSEGEQLESPVNGNVVKPFGYYFDPESKIELFSPGVEIKTKPLTPVKSIYSGFVEFAGPLKGYDYVVLIRHPGNYFSVYGHLEVPVVRKDDYVERGQIIGVVADYGQDSTLYFEIRKGEKPVNPEKFIHFQIHR